MTSLDIAWREPTTCWSAEAAQEILPVEAEAIPVPLFQQAHVPLHLTRVNPENLTPLATDDVTERDVLELVRARVGGTARRTDIIPVLGRAGAGKSHLVRWLRNELVREPLPRLRTVFIPKHRTSLRGVVELLLDAFSDIEELATLREDLASATDSEKSREQLRTEIRDQLCTGVEFQTDRTTVSPGEVESRDFLAKALPALLRDPHFSPQYLADGSAIAALVAEKLDGRAGDNAVEMAFQFKGDDLKTTADDVSRAAAEASMAAQLLMQDASADPDVDGRTLSELAAQMLNDQLPSAIKTVFGVGGEDLKDLLVRARSILHGREDVLLLVEDFAMFQGLQQGLVDAITLHDTENEHLCALVTVFAVTSGYYRDYMPMTLKTRSSTAFNVGEQGKDAPVRFAASYLRAVRLGLREITERHEAEDRGKSSCDGCPVVEACHDAFGQHDGEGLFPFNRTFLNRAVAATADEAFTFNARAFLNRVLRPVLVDDHRDLERQQYPSAEAFERFDGRAHRPRGSELLVAEMADQGDRRARLALLYKSEVDSRDMPSGIHAAFALPPLGSGPSHTDDWTDDTEDSTDEIGDSTDAAETPFLVEELAKWARSGAMSQRARRETRQLVADAVLDRVDFNDGAFKRTVWTSKPGPFFKVSESVVLDDDAGVLDKEAIQLRLESKEPLDVDALQSLAWLAQEGAWDRVPDGHERAARVEIALDRWTAAVSEELGLRKVDQETLNLVAEAIEAAHAMDGVLASDLPSRGALLATVPQLHGYKKSVAEAVQSLSVRMLRSIAYARGDSGGVATLDFLRTQTALDKTTRGRALVALADMETPGNAVYAELLAVAQVTAKVDDDPESVRRLMPEFEVLGSESPTTLAEDLTRLATGRVPQQQLEELQRLADEVLHEDTAAVSEANLALERWADLAPLERLALVNGPWRDSAARLGAFLSSIETVLRAATPAGVTLGGSDRSEVLSLWETALSELSSVLRNAQKDWR